MSKSETNPKSQCSKPVGVDGFRTFVIRNGFGFVLLVICCLLQGCRFGGAFNIWPTSVTPQKCVLPPEMTKADVIGHLNQNANRLHSWRSTDVQISTAGMPIKLSAVIAVQQPRNFRLRARLVTGNEADFGSNPERFWFWMRRSPDKYVLSSSHEQAGQVQQMMKLPFEPDWLMESLGVIPLNEEEFTMLPPVEAAGIASLVADQVTPAGEPVRRVVHVDMCKGYIIAHELRDSANNLIARAELNDYKLDTESGVSLPHRINLDWPQARLALTMTVGAVQVNPAYIPEQTWEIPRIPGYPVLDLGRLARDVRPSGRARVSQGTIPRTGPGHGVHETNWDNARVAAAEPADSPARQTIQTAEVPEWERDEAAEGWHPPVDRNDGENRIEPVAYQREEVPPFDETNEIAEAIRGHAPSQGGGSTPTFAGATHVAGTNEEPPWDEAAGSPITRKNAKPFSILDLLKAPFRSHE